MDVTAITLAAIPLVQIAYDSIHRLYDGCKVLLAFGRDIQILWRDLEGQWTRLEYLMDTDINNFVNPPDPKNAQHRITRVVRGHLESLATDFHKCIQIIKYQFEQSGLSVDFACETENFVDRRGGSQNTVELHSPSSRGTLRSDKADEELSNTLSRGRNSLLHPKNWFNRHQKAASTGGISSANSSSPVGRIDGSSAAVSPRDRSPLDETFDVGQLVPEGMAVTALSMKGETARKIQASTSLWKHIVWSDHGKQELEGRISHITKTINTLESILVLKEMGEPRRLINSRHSANPPSFYRPAVEEALARLHHAVKDANHGRQPFSISISDTYEDNWHALNEHPGLPLRPESFAFWIQRHETDTASTESILLMVETLRKCPLETAARIGPELPRIQTFDEPTETDASSLDKPKYRTWGALSSSKYPGDEHRVFAQSAHWRRARSLGDYLDDASFCSKLRQTDSLGLCREIMVAHLNMNRVRVSCRDPTVDDYLFFDEPEFEDVEDMGDSMEDEVWPTPYLSCGFGQPPRPRKPGTRLRPLKDVDAAVAMLGLVLFQIGLRSRATFLSPQEQPHVTQAATQLLAPEEQTTAGASQDDELSKLSRDASYLELAVHVGGGLSPAERPVTGSSQSTQGPPSSMSASPPTGRRNRKPFDWRDAKKQAMRNMLDVHRRSGLPFAQIVEACLTSNAENEERTIREGLRKIDMLTSKYNQSSLVVEDY